MATEKPDTEGGQRPMSMKERLLAQRAAQAGGASAPPPVPASKPAARPPDKPAGGASAPSAPQAAAAKPAPAPAAEPPRVESRAAAARPAPRPVVKPPTREESRARKTASADVLREVELLKKQQDKWVMYGWIVAGVMILGAGSFWLIVQGKKQAEVDARQAYEKSVTDLVDQILAFNVSTDSGANAAIARADATMKTMPDGSPGWKDTYVEGAAGKITGHVSKARNFLETEKRRKELTDGLAAIEVAARDASSKRSDELAQLRRRIGEYESNASLVGPEFETRVAKAKIDINRAYVRRTFDEAKALADKGPGEYRAALQAFTKAEDEARTLMDEAVSRNNQDAILFIQPIYQQVIEESDKLVYAMFTPDVVDKTPWKDLLDTPGTEWLNDGLKGFRTEGGVVQAVGLDPGARRLGIFSVGDREKWRDFVMEVEFVPIKGESILYWRLGKKTESSPDEVRINFTGDFGYKPGQTYGITASYIGSRREFHYSANLEAEPDKLDPINWRRNRAGAFGVTVSEGGEFKITKLRIKLLR